MKVPPDQEKDGKSITTVEEVKLWRAAMEFFHDIKSDDEDDEDEEEEEEAEKVELAPGAAGVPALSPPPGKSPLAATAALAAAAAKAAAPAARQTRPLKARALHEVDLPHPLGSQCLLQMTCGRSSSRSTVRIKSHWISSCRA